MRRIGHLLLIVLLASGLLVATAQAQTQVGTVEGTVIDQQGGVLPGVTVTLTGPRGSQTAVTGGQGEYRFVAVQPATYVVRAELSGFLIQERDSVLVGMGKSTVVDFGMKVGGVTESVEVVGTASTVDVKSSATDTSLSSALLTAMPIYSSTSTGLMNSAPGVNSSSAYGGQSSYGNALLMDGVDTRDPEGGSAWTFFNQNLIEEIQIGGLGAPAEYGGFTGGIVNTITRSGGNAFSGLFSLRYTEKSLASKNITPEMLKANPSLGASSILKKLTDYTVQMGGPIVQNKAFFFASVQRYSAVSDPSGPVANAGDISPRFNVKVTLQPTATDTIIAGFQYDSYNVTGRVGYWPSNQATDQQTVEEDAPEWVWNFQWRKVFGSSTLLEAKLTGYDGYYYLDPVDPSPFTYDVDTDTYTGGGGGEYYADRGRNQLQVSLTKYAEKFGKHSFKFGAEIERSHVRSQYQPYGPAGFYIYQYASYYPNNYRVHYGYDVQGDNKRTSFYAQDQWNAGRLTFNLGLRLDHLRGNSPVLKKDVYTPHWAVGPRLGVAYDLTGKGTNVLKGFYGHYFEGTASAFYTSATPGVQDYTWTAIYPNGSLGPVDVLSPGVVYGISNDMNHPRTDEFNVAWESQLTKDLRFTATGIYRTTHNFINNVYTDSRYRTVQLTNTLTKQPFTGYYWANPSASDASFQIRNTEGWQYRGTDGSVIATADPRRSYKALMLLLSNSFKGRWGFQVSYVLAKAEGSVDNSGFGAWVGGSTWRSPNTSVINNFGELTNSRRHEFKAYVTYQIPKIDVMLSGAYTGTSGRPYTPYDNYSRGALGRSANIWLMPLGSERNDFYNNFDLRAEKYFDVTGGHRFGVYIDVANLFNTASVTSRLGRYPSSAGVLYKSPTGVQGARQATIGGRWSF